MGIQQTGLNTGVDTETGEKLIKQELWLKTKQVAKVIDVRNRKNTRHVKFRSARAQRRVYDKLSMDEAGLLLKLISYMSWETNLVVGDGELGEKSVPLRWSQIDTILSCSKPHRIKLVKALEEKKVIGYLVIGGKRVGVVINPKFAINGYRPDDELLKAFESDRDIFDDDEEEE